MREIEMLLRFLRYTTGLTALCWDGTDAMLEDIEKQYCFSRQAQPLLTASGLRMAFEQVKAGTLYETEDLLGIHCFFFQFQGKMVWVGPFVTEGWSEDGAAEERRLIGAGLLANYLLPYKLYYCSHCSLSQSGSVQIVTGAITALLPDVPPYTYHKLAGVLGHHIPEVFTGEDFDFDTAAYQIDLEKKFFTLVNEGQTEAALDLWSRMEQIPLSEQLGPHDLQRLISNTTGLRFLLRMVAEQSGVHPATAYAISLSYGQKLFSLRDRSGLKQITHDMIREFSTAVQAAHSRQYSPAVWNVINYLNLHIAQKTDMKQLAAVADCGQDVLRQRFRAETGLTVAQYVARERCRNAENLLQQTDLPISEISAQVGYLDNNYFVKVFKRHAGETPTDYRARFRQQ